MTEQNLIAQARAAVEGILDALGVARVVFVDDTNGEGASLEEVIAAAAGLDRAQLESAFPELADAVPDELDVLRQRVRDVWRQLDGKTQEERTQAVLIAARLQDEENTNDIGDASILGDLVPEAKLISLSPLQWEAQKEQLLRDSQDQRTLFLFDRDFSEIGGDPEGGIKIIASLLSRNDTEGLICGLLTHTVTPETQPQQWVELSKSHNIPRDRFVVVPKLHLSKAPILFAQTLKFAALSPDFSELKTKTKKIIADASEVSASRVDEVSIYDLDHIVFQVPAEEGLWEPDMLFRLHALFHRLEARRLAHEGGALEVIASKLRAVSGIPTSCDEFGPPSSAWALQREELYESEDHINRNHLPLEVGDIFERVGSDSNKRYVLLAQPCDLMVRGDGKRHPELNRVPLVEVVCASKAPRYAEEMPYFSTSPAERWYARLKLVHFVRVWILDLCVLNTDGIARLTVNDAAPPGIRPAWRARHKVLSRHINRKIRKADVVTPLANDSQGVAEAKRRIARDVEGLLFEDDLFKGNLTETGGAREVEFNCRRVARLSRARAIGLLMSYTSALARPAFDRDFVAMSSDETD